MLFEEPCVSRRPRSRTSACGETRNTSRCMRPTPSWRHRTTPTGLDCMHMKGLVRLARLAQNANDYPGDNDMRYSSGNEVVAGPSWRAARRLAASTPAAAAAARLSPYATGPCASERRAPNADSRAIKTSLGASNNGCSRRARSAPGLGDRRRAACPRGRGRGTGRGSVSRSL
jgi:hypothetical protein